MEQVDPLHLGVLFVELLIFCPPLPRHRVDQLGRLLLQSTGVVEDPLGLFLVGRRRELDSDALVQRVLHAKNLFELVHRATLPNRSARWQGPTSADTWPEFTVAPCGKLGMVALQCTRRARI